MNVVHEYNIANGPWVKLRSARKTNRKCVKQKQMNIVKLQAGWQSINQSIVKSKESR